MPIDATAEVSPGKLPDRLEIWVIPTEVYGKHFQTPHETHFINYFIGCLAKSFSQKPKSYIMHVLRIGFHESHAWVGIGG